MLIKFIHFLHEKRFLHYATIGASAFMLDYASLYILKEYLGLNPILAVVIYQPFVILYVFLLNKYWSFKAQGDSKQQAIKFISLTIFNYIFGIIWMWFWVTVVGFTLVFTIGKIEKDLGYMIVRFLNIILAISWNFLLYKFWIYKIPKLVVIESEPK